MTEPISIVEMTGPARRKLNRKWGRLGRNVRVVTREILQGCPGRGNIP